MSTYSKQLLSGSSFGKQIVITGTVSPGTTVHTTSAGTASLDEVWLYACNNGTTASVANVLWGGTASGDLNQVNIGAQTGRVLVTDGKLLQNGNSVTVYVSSGTLCLDGFVNRIS